MFGFSLFKIIFTIVVVVVVWNAFKYFSRVQDQRAKTARMKGQSQGHKKTSASQPQTDGIEDMIECKVCDAYVARGAKSCGRDDCPFTG